MGNNAAGGGTRGGGSGGNGSNGTSRGASRNGTSSHGATRSNGAARSNGTARGVSSSAGAAPRGRGTGGGVDSADYNGPRMSRGPQTRAGSGPANGGKPAPRGGRAAVADIDDDLPESLDHDDAADAEGYTDVDEQNEGEADEQPGGDEDPGDELGEDPEAESDDEGEQAPEVPEDLRRIAGYMNLEPGVIEDMFEKMGEEGTLRALQGFAKRYLTEESRGEQPRQDQPRQEERREERQDKPTLEKAPEEFVFDEKAYDADPTEYGKAAFPKLLANFQHERKARGQLESKVERMYGALMKIAEEMDAATESDTFDFMDEISKKGDTRFGAWGKEQTPEQKALAQQLMDAANRLRKRGERPMTLREARRRAYELMSVGWKPPEPKEERPRAVVTPKAITMRQQPRQERAPRTIEDIEKEADRGAFASTAKYFKRK